MDTVKTQVCWCPFPLIKAVLSSRIECRENLQRV